MKYNHSRKAGNQGDLWKHFVLVELAQAVSKKSDIFCYIEGHSGAPIHELSTQGEWTGGVGQLLQDGRCDFEYISTARKWLITQQYPAGWVFVASELSKRFKKVEVNLCDTDDDVAASYSQFEEKRIPSNIDVMFRQQNGFKVLEKIAGHDLVFLDPPFHPDAESDWQQLTTVCMKLNSSNTDFIVWYPFYGNVEPQELVDRTMSVAWEVHWVEGDSERPQDLHGCGMLVSENLIPLMQKIEIKLNRMVDSMKAKLVVRQPDENVYSLER